MVVHYRWRKWDQHPERKKIHKMPCVTVITSGGESNLQTLVHTYKVTPFAMKKWPDNRDDLSGKGDKFSSVYYLSASETWLVKG